MYCMYHSLISIHKRAANAKFSWINLFSSYKGLELLDDAVERGVIEDVLQMAVRKQLFSLFPIINSEKEHVEAALPFEDEDLTAEVARVDLSTLSLIKAYGDMFNASKILQALQGRDSTRASIEQLFFAFAVQHWCFHPFLYNAVWSSSEGFN